MSLKINTLLGIGLDVQPPSFFTTAHLRENGASGTILRMLYYPPLSATDASTEDVRAGAHSDYGSITMLFRLRGQAGLEILTRDNTWAPVPVSPPGTENDPAPPILVNIGDLLSYWTNGLLRSTVHRVVFPGPGKGVVDGETASEPRYSIAFFCHPVGTAQLTAVPSARVRDYAPPSDAGKGNPYAERKVMTADEHLQMRLRASYLQLYDEKK
jgi:isopenicillin N synthase-like dioxygenase